MANGSTPAIQRIANRPIACHAVESLVAAGVADVAVIAPACMIDEVRAHVEDELAAGVQATFLPQRERNDLLGALTAAASFVGDDEAVVHFADGLLGQPLDQLPRACADGVPDLLFLLHCCAGAREGLAPATQALLGVTELAAGRTRLSLADVCLFGPGALGRAVDAAAHLAPDAGLIEIAQHAAAEGEALEAALVRSWRRYAGDPHDLLELNRIVLDQQPLQAELIDTGDNRIEGRVTIDASAEVSSSIILGPCIIGPHARVMSSYIGPYTSIGANTDIEGVEIVHSIISEGVHIKHISGRIERSTIGRRASIFRDFRLPRAMRLHVGEGVEVALE